MSPLVDVQETPNSIQALLSCLLVVMTANAYFCFSVTEFLKTLTLIESTLTAENEVRSILLSFR